MKKKQLSLPAWIGIAMGAGIILGGILWAAMGVKAAEAFTTSYIKPFGTIFINLLKFVVVPIVLLSIIDGIVSMKDIKKVGSIGWKTMAYFLATTAIACVIGLVIASFFEGFFPVLKMSETQAFHAGDKTSIMDTIVDIFPSNLWLSLSSASMLQVIVIAILFGAGILMVGEKGKLATDVVSSFYAVMMKVMMFIISISPIGVFCLMTWVVASQGPQILGSLTIVLAAAYLGYILHAVIVYSMSVKAFAGMSPMRFFRSIIPAVVFAFSSSSSIATLPISKQCCDKMDVDPEISSFVLPLGATINMDGTAIYQCVATVFIACCVGVHLSMSQMVLIVVTATLASIGTAGTTGAGVIMLTMVLQAIGIDPTYIGLIFGIDRLFDMGRTTVNIVGDISCSVCVHHWESGKLASKKAAVQ
ncbi:dicarboxylate/amino acid:cation symporter [Caproiciproducens sp. NJN-50]|uniref:dicarboxylate/amino acid:cation symporter n=1 Tax=Acutalibacteraceae TaxID=3082771 RepID=UPI000FFDFA0B|nr:MULTISPECIES: dicarboxylate/amino acid:cation symporter [Acutalibacteraceae]QAT49453.1 dicarboxylate/amino acid:cation symporter [Caproiciproducens sp. NJN-50]